MQQTNKLLEWSGSILAVTGATLLAFHVSFSGWAFVIYLLSSFILLAWGVRNGAYGIAAQNLVFTIINMVGIYRWLIVGSIS